MESPAQPSAEGSFEVRYLAFLETITHLRPKLHRYCARMTGSVLDGEDVVQEALFQAYRKLDTFDDARPLAPWLFRIAHNCCVDFLRRRVELEGDAQGEAGPSSTSGGSGTGLPTGAPSSEPPASLFRTPGAGTFNSVSCSVV